MSDYGNAVWNETPDREFAAVPSTAHLAGAILGVDEQAQKVASLLSDLETRLGYVCLTQPQNIALEDVNAKIENTAPISPARDDLERVGRSLRFVQSRIRSLTDRIEL